MGGEVLHQPSNACKDAAMQYLYDPEGHRAHRNSSRIGIGTMQFPLLLVNLTFDPSLSTVWVIRDALELIQDAEAAYCHAHLDAVREVEPPQHLAAERVIPYLAHNTRAVLILDRHSFAEWLTLRAKDFGMVDADLLRSQVLVMARGLGWPVN